MVVFIGNLPRAAVEKELCQIAQLKNCAGLRIFRKPARSGEMLRYALVPVINERHAEKLIARMHGYRWQGHQLSAHNYASRIAGNEQRRLNWRDGRWSAQERRLSERRSPPAATGLRVA